LTLAAGTRTRCAYKGSASYWHARVGGELHEDVALDVHDAAARR
jgi:uncharacterized protein (DUF427 family)